MNCRSQICELYAGNIDETNKVYVMCVDVTRKVYVMFQVWSLLGVSDRTGSIVQGVSDMPYRTRIVGRRDSAGRKHAVEL